MRPLHSPNDAKARLRYNRGMKHLFLVLLFVSRASAALDARKLEAITGLAPTEKAGELKISIPQKGVGVAVDGFSITPPMGLTTWVAFTEHGEHVMAMGDLVLLEDEVGPVQRAALKTGLTVTAIHNHFLRDRPKVMFMHVGGSGKLETVAAAVRATLDEAALRRAKRKAFPEKTLKSEFEPRELEEIIGHKGEAKDGVFKIVVSRPDVELLDMGAPVTSFLGFNTWMAFQGTKDRAAVAGDFAMLDSEVDGVVRALVEHGIEVAAIHNHMTGEKPRIFFLHFWGIAPAADLARGLKAALDATGKR